MTEQPGTGKAATFSAGSLPTRGLSPADWGDKCFLCSRNIGESEAVGFYKGRNAWARCHRRCIQTMESVGGTPQAYHEHMRKLRGDPDPVEDNAAKLDEGVKALRFDDLSHMQEFISARGPIPKRVKVFIGDNVVQQGDA